MKKKLLARVVPLHRETYLALIKNSVGSKMFRNLYAKVDGERTDIMKDGDLSCAFFVSALLTMSALVQRVHGTVDGTVHDLEKSGWKKVRSPKAGDVLVWEPRMQEKEEHKHIGFSLGNNLAVSNSSRAKVPKQHDWMFGKTKRKVIGIYRRSDI